MFVLLHKVLPVRGPRRHRDRVENNSEYCVRCVSLQSRSWVIFAYGLRTPTPCATSLALVPGFLALFDAVTRDSRGDGDRAGDEDLDGDGADGGEKGTGGGGGGGQYLFMFNGWLSWQIPSLKVALLSLLWRMCAVFLQSRSRRACCPRTSAPTCFSCSAAGVPTSASKLQAWQGTQDKQP